MARQVKLKRIYDAPSSSDGYRILIDRLWPRGITKARAAIDVWLKAVAPSTELRTWFGHNPQKFADFRKRYERELAGNPAFDELLAAVKQHQMVTLLFAAKNLQVNHAVVLRDALLGRV